MVENIVRQTDKKTWYKWAFYLNIILILIVGVFIYLLIIDSIAYGEANALDEGGKTWLLITRDVAFIGIALTIIFIQYIRNLSLIIRRSL